MVEEGHLCVTPTLDLFFVEQHVQEIVEFSRFITPLMNAEKVFALVDCLDGDPLPPRFVLGTRRRFSLVVRPDVHEQGKSSVSLGSQKFC